VQTFRRQLLGPALALGLAGLLSCVGGLLPLAAPTPEQWVALPPWLANVLAIGPLVGLPLLWGAYVALRVESYWFVKLCCLLALLPCGLGFPVGIIAGTWGLRVLNRPAVNSAFARRAAWYREEMERALEEYDADLREP
jgi:hypothetical protein